MTTKYAETTWHDDPSAEYCIRAEFPDGTVAYTTVEKAADRLDFIDRRKGIADLIAGMRFSSHMGTEYQVERYRIENRRAR